MSTSYDVRVWKIQTRYVTDRKGNKKPSRYVVRWMVGGCRQEQSYKNRAQADSFRSDLVSAARSGEAFDINKGLPVSKLRTTTETMSWYEFACAYVDMKWPGDSPGSRKTTADSLAPVTIAMLESRRGMPDTKPLRRALRLAFNRNRRDGEHPVEVVDALNWIRRRTRPVGDLARPDVLRDVLGAIALNLNGKRGSPDTIRLRRVTLRSALDFAVEEKKLLEVNPLDEVKTKKRKTVLHEVDRRSVANPVQARTLLRAVRDIEPSGPMLEAFFGLMYFAALRPEEAANLRKHNLSLPEKGWGEIHLERAAPEIGAEWTDSGERSEERALKHREDGVTRTVPCCPELTELLHNHLNEHGTTADGRLFGGRRTDGRISSTVYGRVWGRTRAAVFTPEVVAGLLAKRPYDLRHACVSTWLNAGVEATRVAEWAGHSVGVLLRVYAKCLDGGEQEARRKVQERLGGGPTTRERPTSV